MQFYKIILYTFLMAYIPIDSFRAKAMVRHQSIELLTMLKLIEQTRLRSWELRCGTAA